MKAKKPAQIANKSRYKNLSFPKLASCGDHWLDERRRAELGLQFSVYTSGSTNAARIAARPNLLQNMFEDMIALRIDVAILTEWDAALWARMRVNSGTNTAGTLARTALELAERCTGELFFSKSPLVKAQAFPEHSIRTEAEPAKAATPPTWRHIEALEAAIVSGATAQ